MRKQVFHVYLYYDDHSPFIPRAAGSASHLVFTGELDSGDTCARACFGPIVLVLASRQCVSLQFFPFEDIPNGYACQSMVDALYS